MLEAVNSVLQTSSLIRASADQVSSVDSFAANPERVQRVAQAPYVSPYVHVDNNYNKAVLQIRDSDTGDVLNQFPSEERLRTIAQQSSVPVEREGAPEKSEDSALADVQRTSSQAASSSNSVATEGADNSAQGSTAPAGASTQISAQQIAAFQTAAVSGAASSGNVEVFA